MNDKFVFTMWTYNHISEFTPGELDVWVDLGMTIPMLPATVIGRDDPSVLIPWLDHAEELGVRVIVNYHGMGYDEYEKLGEDGYRAKIRPLYDALGSHPAVHGFCLGDEPSPEYIPAALGAIKVNRELAPHLTPFLNYSGNTVSYKNEAFGGRDLSGWMKYVKDTTGTTEICFDEYGQTINDGGGKTGYFDTVSKMVEAGKAADRSDVWGCLLSSGHLVFSPPKEVDYRWQISTAAALGLRGIQWFRLYDRVAAIDYYGSPIDEFGAKTEAYYAMRRCQRRFSNHYGEIFMRLRHKKNYQVNSSRGVFPEFTQGCHEAIDKIEANDETLIGFFDGDDGFEYVAVVDCETRFYGAIRFFFDSDKYDLYEVNMNGAVETPVRGKNGEEINVIPASLHLFKIVRKI